MYRSKQFFYSIDKRRAAAILLGGACIASKMAGKTTWAPEMARVTGVVWGWATSAACLMVTRSEYVRSFLLGAGERI
jgi:hypothetical protein